MNNTITMADGGYGTVDVNFNPILPLLNQNANNIANISACLAPLYTIKDELRDIKQYAVHLTPNIEVYHNANIIIDNPDGELKAIYMVNADFCRENLRAYETRFTKVITHVNITINHQDKTCRLSPSFGKTFDVYNLIHHTGNGRYYPKGEDNDDYFAVKEGYDGDLTFDSKGKVCYFVEDGAVGSMFEPIATVESIVYSYTNMAVVK